jgi:hypothetical protein
MAAPNQSRVLHTLQYGAAAAILSMLIGLAIYALALPQWINYASYLGFAGVAALALHDWGKKREALGLSYGQAFSYSTLMLLFYVVFISIWTVVFIKFIAPGLMETQLEVQRQAMEDKGTDRATIDMAMKMARKFTSLPFLLLFSIIGNMIMMSIVNLIVCAFMRRDPQISPIGTHHLPADFPNYSPNPQGGQPQPPVPPQS